MTETDIEARERIVDAAVGEVGSTDALKYWRDAVTPGFRPPYPKEWCGAFTLWCIHQAGIGLDLHWKVGFGFLYRLPTVLVPRPGDVAYFSRFQHHSVVVEVSDGKFGAVNGNGGGGKVTRGSRQPFGNATAFYSVGSLILGLQPGPSTTSDTRETWREIQARLNRLGAEPRLTIDGVPGPKTRDAFLTLSRVATP